MNDNEYAIESFITFCDELYIEEDNFDIAEEGLIGSAAKGIVSFFGFVEKSLYIYDQAVSSLLNKIMFFIIRRRSMIIPKSKMDAMVSLHKKCITKIQRIISATYFRKEDMNCADIIGSTEYSIIWDTESNEDVNRNEKLVKVDGKTIKNLIHEILKFDYYTDQEKTNAIIDYNTHRTKLAIDRGMSETDGTEGITPSKNKNAKRACREALLCDLKSIMKLMREDLKRRKKLIRGKEIDNF